eukprot:7065726-Lingulodinium_polyedra.AAC.1
MRPSSGRSTRRSSTCWGVVLTSLSEIASSTCPSSCLSRAASARRVNSPSTLERMLVRTLMRKKKQQKRRRNPRALWRQMMGTTSSP